MGKNRSEVNQALRAKGKTGHGALVDASPKLFACHATSKNQALLGGLIEKQIPDKISIFQSSCTASGTLT